MANRAEPLLLINRHQLDNPFEVFRASNSQSIPINPTVLEEDDSFLFSNGRWILINFDFDRVKLVCFELSMSITLEVYCMGPDGQRVDAQFIESGTFTGSPESECRIFLIEILYGYTNTITIWCGTLVNWVVSWTRVVFDTESLRAFSPLYSSGKIFWIDSGGGTYSYDLVTGYQVHFDLPHEVEDSPFDLDENTRFGAMAYLVTIDGTVYSILISNSVNVYVYYMSEAGQDQGHMVPYIGDFTNCHGSIFVSRNQAGVFMANRGLGIHLRDTLWAGPLPSDCKEFSLLTHEWNVRKLCLLASCEGLWLFLPGNNFLELLQRELNAFHVLNLTDHEEEETHKGEGEVNQDSYRKTYLEARDFGTEPAVKCVSSGKGNKLGDLNYVKPLGPTPYTGEIEDLREKRVHLNKQIQLLSEHLQVLSSQEISRHVPRSTASSTSTPAASFSVDTERFNSQVYIRNEPASGGSTTFLYEREAYTPQLIDVNYIDGSADEKLKCRDFPWTKELEVKNKKFFGNHSFRLNQREVINATMSGHDDFVLMPTGGGRSLTYQLPALLSPGITIVVSPLVSLIQDQIMHLSQANIPARYLSANMEWTHQDILRDLASENCSYKLLFVTPEKIAKSDVLLRQLDNLYLRDHLSRIVIDEAHCVSQRGHDFRPDYQSLGILKQKYPNTPVLALTATAAASVREDVVQALGLNNCIVFRQSFNRPNLCSFNLFSEDVPKNGRVDEEVHAMGLYGEEEEEEEEEEVTGVSKEGVNEDEDGDEEEVRQGVP